MTNHWSSIMHSTEKDVVKDPQVEEHYSHYDVSLPVIPEDTEQVMAITPRSPSMELRNYCSINNTDVFPYMDGLTEAEVDEALAMAAENNGEVDREDPQAGETSGQMTPLVVPMHDPVRVRNPNAHSLILGSGNEQGRSYSKKQARKKTSTSEEGCRRCTCKKTRCLKLYCSCFTAEEYCIGECVCEGCRNRREFDDDIRDAKQKIVKQDEHAFRSKFELDPDRNKVNSDSNRNSLEIGKHKKGCNCKKSRCHKNYCECFQAGVACSENCRCNGCNNDHGKREGPADYNDNGNNEQLQMITIAERSESNGVNSNVIDNDGGCGNTMMESTYMNNNGAQYMPYFSPFTPYDMPDRVRDFFPSTSSTTMPMPWQSLAVHTPSLPPLPPRHFTETDFESYSNMYGYRIGSSSTSPMIGDEQIPSACSMNLHNNGRFCGRSILGNPNQSMLLNNGCIDLPDYDGLVAKQRQLQSTYEILGIPPLPNFDRLGKRIFGEQEHPLQLPFGTNSQLLIGYRNKNNNNHNNFDSSDCTSEYEQMLRGRTTDGMMHPVPTEECEMRNVNDADVADADVANADGTMTTHFTESNFYM